MASDAEGQPSHAQDDVPTTPPDNDVPLRASRKREREPSIEPQTPKSEEDDTSASGHEPHDRRARAKKNRLDTVDELDSPPRSPPLSEKAGEYSPGQNAAMLSPIAGRDKDGQHFAEGPKLQQIRERVKDLGWQDESQQATQLPYLPPLEDEDMRDQTQSQQQPHVPLLQEPVEIHSSSGDIVLEDVSGEVSGKESDAPQQPSLLAPSPTIEPPTQPPTNDSATSTVAFPQQQPSHSSDSETPSDPEQLANESASTRQSRKRKLTSKETTFGSGGDFPKKARESKVSTIEPPSSDKEDSKPPTPPVDKVNGNTPTSPLPPLPASPPSKTKQTGFAAFSATASPFAHVKGPSVFGQSQTPPAGAVNNNNNNNANAHPASPPPPRPKAATGFAAFSASVSPFGTVAANAGTSAFGSGFGSLGRTESLPVLGSSSTTTTTTSLNSPERSRSPPSSKASSSNALKRHKSPPPTRAPKPGAAFGVYNSPGSTSMFGAVALKGTRHSPSPSLESLKRKGDEGEEEEGDLLPSKRGAASWGEMLVAGNGDQGSGEDDAPPTEKKLVVEEVDVMTGEEDEDTLHQVRAKLYHLDDSGNYKERGTGTLKVNVRKSDGTGARLVMRSDGVLRLLLNVALFPGMGCFLAQDPRYVRISCIENGVASHYAIRVGNPKSAQELLTRVQEFTAPVGQEASV